jgi:hypothetical protein
VKAAGVALVVVASLALGLAAAARITGASASPAAQGQRTLKQATVTPHQTTKIKPKKFRVPIHEERN